MHSILFAITKPASTAELKAWNDLAAMIEQSKANKSVQMIGVGSCLVFGADGFSLLGDLTRGAQKAGLDYQVLMIREATDWKGVELSGAKAQ